ncbi:hypothetical protein [Sphingomonas nostoxanthinifaciens]|uniref:hypothetical protein n=1 Tax=Sphingomonas nostoxanthinifaciens TaxID=2872652 RepID=UPI001CC1C325|nr:hypothetical protein [Sphingomonas nostoxanthinifaciens]UAK23065.1 hypothetical protein K8P63_11570 [Sphingomonas nostoxanthinifaciens]
MAKSATDVMQDILVSTVLDAVDALKASSKGVPNALLRDLNAIHRNTAFPDFPADLQAAVTAAVRDAFNRLRKEGYAVSPAVPGAPPPRPAGPRPTALRPGGPRPGSPRGRADRKPGAR